MKLSVNFDCIKVNGEYRCEIGNNVLSARTKAELSEKVHQHVMSIAQPPTVGLVKCGKKLAILSFHGNDSVETFVTRDEDPSDGHVVLRQTSYGCLCGKTAKEECDRLALHFALQGYDASQGIVDPPDWLDSSLHREFNRSIKFQIAYRTAINSGFSVSDAHKMACSMS
jgi:hypothetical protein